MRLIQAQPLLYLSSEMTRMKNLSAIVFLGFLATAACSPDNATLEVKPGSTVTLQKKDGVTLSGRLVEVKPEHLVIETASGRAEVRRAEVTALKTDSALVSSQPAPAAVKPVGSTGVEAARLSEASSASDPEKRSTARAAEYREVTLPAGTVLPVELTTGVGSDSSSIEDTVRGTLRRAVTAGGVQAFPAGTPVSGHVTAADRSARVKGRARVAFRFTTIDPPGDAERLTMRTDTIARVAEATKKQDAAKIGGGAAGGAIIGGILGGGDGAAKGAAIGGAAGTGVVLSTRGKEVHLAAGTPVSVRLASPLTVRVPVR
jgi:hypothetical protein